VRNGATHEDTFTIEIIFSTDPENVHKLMVTDYYDLLEYVKRLTKKDLFEPCSRSETKYSAIDTPTAQLKEGKKADTRKKDKTSKKGKS